jgi:hypothetical protein
MFHVPSPRWTLISLIGVALLANGQPATPPAGAASSTASADLSYRSAMEGYQRFSDEKVGSWREANDNVGRIGGWREYAKEAQGATSTVPAAGAASPAPARAAASAPTPARPAASAARPASQSGAPTVPAAAPAPHSGHGKH